MSQNLDLFLENIMLTYNVKLHPFPYTGEETAISEFTINRKKGKYFFKQESTWSGDCDIQDVKNCCFEDLVKYGKQIYACGVYPQEGCFNELKQYNKFSISCSFSPNQNMIVVEIPEIYYRRETSSNDISAEDFVSKCREELEDMGYNIKK